MSGLGFNERMRECSRYFLAFNKHVWFAEGKWIDVLGMIEIREAVIDEAMRRFIRPNSV